MKPKQEPRKRKKEILAPLGLGEDKGSGSARWVSRNSQDRKSEDSEEDEEDERAREKGEEERGRERRERELAIREGWERNLKRENNPY
uniref:Uncharacterized protein n=1 Tax=Cucumis melo TaxID=3656 RepID=A0A9I9D418_CUCME